MRKRISPTILERAVETVPEFKDVLRKLDEQVTLRGQSQSTLENYSRRTAVMGGHEQVCSHCGDKGYSYNSCGDRLCPKCQLSNQALWVEKVTKRTLPVKHFRIIVTVPHHLNRVCLWNPSMYYNLLIFCRLADCWGEYLSVDSLSKGSSLPARR